MTAELAGRIWGWAYRKTVAGEMFRRPLRTEGLNAFEAAWVLVS